MLQRPPSRLPSSSRAASRPGPLLVRPLLLLGVLAVAPGLVASCDGSAPVDEGRRDLVGETGPELAVEWGELAYDLAWEHDQFLSFKGQRAIAMTHLAMHDALQAIVPVYAPYAYDAHEPGADPAAAAARAAYEVLAAEFPDRAADLDEALARTLAGVPEGAAKTAGVALGSASAQALLDQRADDGWDEPGTYEYRTEPGQYRTTPPWDGFTLQPGFGRARPFSFEDPTSFRPAPAPPLDSPEYARDLDEVRLQGDSTSASRTEDETAYAVWWMEFSEGSVGRLARRMLLERRLDLWEANRTLAHLYVALYDGYVSNWDSKYEYNRWRPYTAIRAAAEDGNAATAPDADWVPLRPTPPFPEYASAHATGCAAAFEVMTDVFGDEVAFEATTLTAPEGMPSRSFASFRAAAEECAESRIHLGWHFRHATDAGLEAGESVARHVLATLLSPR